eukprot:8611829-Pyramimonas_sp.AAC.1
MPEWFQENQHRLDALTCLNNLLGAWNSVRNVGRAHPVMNRIMSASISRLAMTRLECAARLARIAP